MTRVRRNLHGSDPLLVAPPASLLPDSITKLQGELARLTDEHTEAGNLNADLRTHRGQHDDEARRADAQGAAEAAREGKDATGTPHRDALTLRRTQAEQRASALADAIESVRSDLRAAMDEYAESPAGRAAIDGARKKLQRAAEAFHKTLTEAAQAKGVHDWLRGLPYDDSAYMHILDLSPDAGRSIGPALLDVPPINGLTAVLALAQITD